jgi:hypothetical protein
LVTKAAPDAHHNTDAKLPDKSIPRWQKAGSLALKRMALTAAIAQLNKGLDLVAALPASAEQRDGRERICACGWALRGWRSKAGDLDEPW